MFAAVIQQAAAMAPQALNEEIDELLVDADGLCYFCAGSETTSPAQSLLNVQEKLRGAETVAGCRATLVATSRDSLKGNRFTIATVRAYQGNRGGSTKPKNWAFLRQRMLAGDFGRSLEVEEYAEADDLCASRAGPRVALHYQDKDFRMMPGWHITWKDYALVYVKPDCWALDHNGLLYGEKWFWHQMLQGDPADGIPGIPRLFGKLCGPKTAEKYLSDSDCREDAQNIVALAYEDHYKDCWRPMLLEQAQLLWMRKDPKDDLCVVHNGPLQGMGYA